MRIAVSGATGFLGRHLIPLVASTHEVISLVRSLPDTENCPWLEATTIVQVDFENTQIDTFESMGRPDKLIHLAWGNLADYATIKHIEESAIHYLFLQNAITNGLKDLTVIGTCFEYGLANGEQVETINNNPVNAYAVAKDSLRRNLAVLAGSSSILFRWIRLFYVYGVGQNPRALFPQLMEALRRGDKEFPMSFGDQIRDFIPVGDAVLQIAQIALQDSVTGVVNCCSGRPISVRRFVESILKQAGGKIELKLGVFPYSKFEPIAFWGSTSRLEMAMKGSEIESFTVD